ncbi:VOC family protein [Streptomyces mirabilis]|uniref:VOC family protein n=1 Tax=Streptomyces mirabilis TaxID=68239 RepID=UPI00332F8106
MHFTVDDVEAAARAARAHGGTAHQQGLYSTEAILTDPDGARFFVTVRREL